MYIRSISLFAAMAAIGLTTGVASAADLSNRAPAYVPPAPPPFTWNGFYMGVHGGTGWGTAESTLNPVPGLTTFSVPLASHNVSGWLFGGQAGYNWQVQPWLVLGVEGDFAWNDIEGRTACVVVVSCQTKNKWMGDVTGRLGFNVDRALLYVKGGVAWSNVDYDINIPPGVVNTGGFSGSTSATRSGALFGMGIEYAFMPNWSAKIEYNYLDLGSSTRSFVIAGTPVSGQVNEKVSLMKAGVNYRFNWGM